MFKKDSLTVSETDTLIGEESLLEGNIRSRASLRIEGKLHGDIHCDGDVTIGKNGVLNSNIRARNVYNAGVVHGSIESESLIIQASGAVHGNIKVRSLNIAEGGLFQGTSKMEPKMNSTPPSDHDQHSNLRKLEKKKKDDSESPESSNKQEKTAVHS